MEENNTFNVIKEIIEKVYGYLKKEKHLSVVTWITTASITVLVAMLKFVKFVSETGRLGYWEISPSIVNHRGVIAPHKTKMVITRHRRRSQSLLPVIATTQLGMQQ